jgi:DNA-binding MarR family transcriptional regulator
MTPSTLLNLLEWVALETSTEIQVSTLRVFLFVATREKAHQKEIEDHLSSTGASASRNVAYWTKVRFDRKPGMDFLQREEDPNDRRNNMITLTAKGKAFYTRLKEKL